MTPFEILTVINLAGMLLCIWNVSKLHNGLKGAQKACEFLAAGMSGMAKALTSNGIFPPGLKEAMEAESGDKPKVH